MGGISVFWHICGINHWRSIAEDQFKTIQSSGLLERADKVFVTYLGRNRSDIAWLEGKSGKIEVNNYSGEIRHYERMCLNGLWKWSQSNDATVLYMHAKGVSRVGVKNNVWGWRKMLEYFLVENHEVCLREMGDADTLGGNLCICNRSSIESCSRPGHGMHYSGNFWWAKTRHIRTLPAIPEDVRMEINGNYVLYTEYWLLSQFPKTKCGVVFKTKHPHYYEGVPESNFREKWIRRSEDDCVGYMLKSPAASPIPRARTRSH